MKSKSNPFLRPLATAALITLIAPTANADNTGNYDWTGASTTNDNFSDATNWASNTWDQWSDYRFSGTPTRTSATINDFFGIASITLQSGLTTDIVINSSQSNPVIMSTGQAGGTSASISIADDSKNLTINGRYIVGGSPVTWNVGSGRMLTLNGALEDWYGNASLVKNGDGTAVLTADNSYSGGTTISSGTLEIGNGGATGTLGSGAVTIASTLDKSTKKFSYTRRTGSGLDYSVWFSENLAVWTEDTPTAEVVTPIPSTDNETVEVTLSNLPGDPLPAKLFIQVRAD